MHAVDFMKRSAQKRFASTVKIKRQTFYEVRNARVSYQYSVNKSCRNFEFLLPIIHVYGVLLLFIMSSMHVDRTDFATVLREYGAMFVKLAVRVPCIFINTDDWLDNYRSVPVKVFPFVYVRLGARKIEPICRDLSITHLCDGTWRRWATIAERTINDWLRRFRTIVGSRNSTASMN